MKRRDLGRLGLAAPLAGGLAAPKVAQAQGARVLKFIPHANLAVMDPIWTTAYISRNHGYLVWDTLFGLDDSYRTHPQMLEGWVSEDGGRLWRFTLRSGMTFHDGSPVRSADVLASITRWARRDAFGAKLASQTAELKAESDLVFTIRLTKPFPLLPDALGKPVSNACFIMPERVANTDPFTAIKPEDVIGSGPFRFKRDEFNSGSMVVYERFAGYRPREQGQASFTSGPKVAHFDRVEWRIIPDAATASAALQAGEVDWWEQTTSDYLPIMARARGVTTEVMDPLGLIGVMRPNHLHAPMDNKAFRQALLRAVSQEDYMTAVTGTDPKLWKKGTGAFTPGTPLATDVGVVDVFKEDLDLAKRMIAESGYKGEKITLLGTTDLASLVALSQVAGDMFRRLGVNLDYQAMDWGTVVQRRASKEPLDKGGWSAFCTFWAGLDHFNPASHHMLRGQGEAGFIGWPKSERLEALRDAWFEAPDLDTQKRIATDLQRQLWEDVPYIPLGQYYQLTSYRSNLQGVLKGIPIFWNVRRA